MINFLRELSRRKVTRVAAGYIVILWALTLGFAELFPVFGLGDWAVRAFILVGLIGLPFAIFLSWRYNLTSAGIVLDPMDFPEPPLTPSKIRAWCERRQEGAMPVALKAQWHDATQARQARFSDVVLIGREASNDISIADQRVSRLHAAVWFEPSGWRVRDLGSSNGSFLNDEPLAGQKRMPSICELRMHPKGPVVRFEIVDEDRTLLTLHGYGGNDREGEQ